MVREDDGSIEVCASVRAGSMQTSVVVSVTSVDGTATGELLFFRDGTTCDCFNILLSVPSDYSSVNQGLTFSQSSSRECVNVSIVNDDELENVEEFKLTLTTGEDRVNLDPNATTVRITDDDGEEIVINTSI